ncbi:hypothetical protein I2I05_03780 [Hymenobacter sp. BT683]|uniref:HTTM domain-containing protein n=1 Tax=Hymenobacter jeongseonensis TaxID=2791027 RepID=A0ABS0IDT6_9BACT|nr:hypothetical protein [Hymenobacter jeongseonensis]MBF9236508.1 hypothetical protein [Hymenobacter jeongseonensis]
MSTSVHAHELTSVLVEENVQRQAATPLVPGSRAADYRRYQVFCVAWAASVLFHMAQSRLFTTELHYALLTGAAIALMLRPASMLRLSALMALQLYEGLVRLPYVPNHWVFAIFINLTILQAYFYLAFQRRSLRVDKAELIRTFAPVVRVEVIILYLVVVLHKLNWGFLAPDVSCAALLLKAQNLDGVLPVPPAFATYNIYFTLAVETLIPVLLMFRRTRNAGLLLGVVFHFIIAFNSLNGFYDFSGMIFAAYLLFASYSFSDTVVAFYHRLAQQRGRIRERLAPFNFRNVAGLAALFFTGLLLVAVLTTRSKDYFRVVWALYGAVFILLFLFSLRRSSQLTANTGLRLPGAAFLLVPVLVLVNGLTPYLGLKTETAYAMFSNLRTEGGVTNHLFIPVSTQVFGYQKDMVEIVSSSDPELQKIARRNQIIPYFQFKNHVAIARPAQVDYLRNGTRHSFTRAAAAPTDDLLHRSSFLMRKLMLFRAVAKAEPQPCEH